MALEIRALIVLCVRNSLIEDLNFSTGDHYPLLRDRDMPALTGEAASFFHKIDLSRAALPLSADLFGSLCHRFPNAWECLSTLAHTTTPEAHYTLQIKTAEPIRFMSQDDPLAGPAFVTASGIAGDVDPSLERILTQIERLEQSVLFVPSFARLTRNPEKLLGVLDHVLRHGATFVTFNYVLSDTYVARRNPLNRPPHDAREVSISQFNSTGLSRRHKELLGLVGCHL